MMDPVGVTLRTAPPKAVRIRPAVAVGGVAFAAALAGGVAYGILTRSPSSGPKVAEDHHFSPAAETTTTAFVNRLMGDTSGAPPASGTGAGRAKDVAPNISPIVRPPAPASRAAQSDNRAAAAPTALAVLAPPPDPAAELAKLKAQWAVEDAQAERQRRLSEAAELRSSAEKARGVNTAVAIKLGSSSAGLSPIGGTLSHIAGSIASLGIPTQGAATGAGGLGTGALASLAGATGAGQAADFNGQTGKQAFAAADPSNGDYLAATRLPPQSALQLGAGAVLPAVMVGGVNSDLPGQLTARVSDNVCDSATGRWVLIPQGSSLMGTYNSSVSYGQDRVQVSWTSITYPDGSTLDLHGMAGADAGGYAGFHDQVDNHIWGLIGYGLLTSSFAAAYQLSQPQTTSGNSLTPSQVVGSTVGQGLSQTGQAFAQKQLQLQPTLNIRPGYQFNVMVNKAITFPSAYRSCTAQ